MRSSMKSIPEYHIGKTFKDRLEQLWIIAGIVFQIRILNQDDITGRVPESTPQRRALPLILLVQHELNRHSKCRFHAPYQFGKEFSCSIPRAVIDDYKLVL